MSFKTTQTTLSAAVATSGTFTISYPPGTSAGSFAGAHAHKLWADKHSKLYSAPKDFTLAFGASNITVTYKGTTSLPVGTRVNLQVDILGTDDLSRGRTLNNDATRRGFVHVLDLGSPAAAVTNTVAASQSVAAAGSFILNGASVVNGVAVFDVPRNVVAAWTTASVLTITGKDVDGNTVVEASASGTSHTGTKAFKSITSVSSTASITSATVGTGSKIGLPVYVADASWIAVELMNGVALPRPAGRVILPWEIEQTQLLAPTAEDLIAPVAGYIGRMRSTVQAAITTGGTLAVAINGGASIVGLTQTIANSATKGTRQSTSPTTRHGSDSLVAAGDRITITPASFATAGEMSGNLDFDTTAAGQLDGTFVAGDTTTPTSLTGDTRGTYTPAITLDGTLGYVLVVSLPDPTNAGVAQFAG